MIKVRSVSLQSSGQVRSGQSDSADLPHLSSVEAGLAGPLLSVISDYPASSALQLPVVECHLLIDLSLQQGVALVIHHADVDDLLAEVLQDLSQLAVLVVGAREAGSDVVAVLVVIVRQSCRDLSLGVALTDQSASLPVFS